MPTKVPTCMMNHATNHGIAYLNPSYIKLCAPKPNDSKPSNIPVKSKNSIIFLPPRVPNPIAKNTPIKIIGKFIFFSF